MTAAHLTCPPNNRATSQVLSALRARLSPPRGFLAWDRGGVIIHVPESIHAMRMRARVDT